MKFENTLKRRWKHLCEEYLDLFCQKHGFDYSDAYWIRDNYGGMVEVADHFIDMDDIRFDIDNEVPEELFEEWYNKSLDEGEKETIVTNFETYVMNKTL